MCDLFHVKTFFFYFSRKDEEKENPKPPKPPPGGPPSSPPPPQLYINENRKTDFYATDFDPSPYIK